MVSFSVRVLTRAKNSPRVTWDLLTLSVKLGAESWGPRNSLLDIRQNDIRDPSGLSRLLPAKKKDGDHTGAGKVYT